MRESGILMHITSLPGPYGVGTMGREAYRFVDFLQKAGQKYWQVLPLTPTGYGDSPYQSCSTYAGNPYLIDLDLLMEQGLLTKADLASCAWGENENRVDFGLQYENRFRVLRQAYLRFQDWDALESFCRDHYSWLPDFALFMALKAQQGGKPWYAWDTPLKHRDPEAMWQVRKSLKDEIRFYSFVQYLFHTQWEALRDYAHEAGIQIIGDVPIYVPYDSADVWSDPEWFWLDETLTPVAVAGCPPDDFNADGQLWGNPLYRWDLHKKDGYGWWLKRLRGATSRYDMLRIDHFRGFAGYYAVPYGAENARSGQWLPGPGLDFIRQIQKNLPDTPMIAEDLGFLTEDVHQLRDASGYPGMKVLEFAFDEDSSNVYLPHMHIPNSVCYVGTHDNMPVRQWLSESREKTVAFARSYMGQEKDPVWGMIRLCMASISELAVVQLQDYLALGSEGRMNFPGTCTGNNWTWRVSPHFLDDDALAERIRELTCIYGRCEGE